MVTLTSVDYIGAPAERVWHFLTHLHEGDTYLRWHPKDHKAFRLLSGDGETVGSTFNAVEMLGGKKFSLKYQLDKAKPRQYLGYSAGGLLRPLRLASGSFTIKPVSAKHTKLTAVVNIGYRLPVLDWFVRKTVNLAAIEKHMDEEGHYLNMALLDTKQ